MPTDSKIVVAGETFKSKAALYRRVKALLSAAPVGRWLGSEEFCFVRALLNFHPEADRKIGVGVDRIRVELVLGNRATFLRRVDGTETDFSWRQCIFGKQKDEDLLGAMRLAVVDQIQRVKALVFSGESVLRCPVTGDEMTRETCHVDHEPPKTFNLLVAEFLASEGLSGTSVMFDGHEDGSLTVRLADRELERRWQGFHWEHANLRVVSRRANLSTIKRGTGVHNAD